LKLDHHIHSHVEKSIIERTMQYLKDRTMNALTTTFLARERNVN
jgi:putative transposase